MDDLGFTCVSELHRKSLIDNCLPSYHARTKFSLYSTPLRLVLNADRIRLS